MQQQQLNDLEKVLEFKRKSRLPQTVVCFKFPVVKFAKIYVKKLFLVYSNELPFHFFNVHTGIDYDYSGPRVHSEEALVFYVFTGCLPPKIEISNILYCYRKAIDPEFKNVMYKNLIRFDGFYIQKLTFEESMEKIKVLKAFNYVEKEKTNSL